MSATLLRTVYAVKIMPRPRSLTVDQIASAALQIVDRAGLAALSMRAVAHDLGVGTMSLYRYVADREALEVLVVDRMLDDVGLPQTSSDHAAALAALAGQVRAIGTEHPHAVPLLLAHRHRSPRALDWGESVLTHLAAAGIDAEDRVFAFRTLLAFVFGALQTGQLGGIQGAGTDVIAGLPALEYPMLSAAAARARTISSHEEFHRGLQLVLTGIGL